MPRCGFSFAVSGSTMPLKVDVLFIEDLDDQAVTKWLQVHSTCLLTAL